MRYSFGDHQLDTERRELKRGDSPVALEPQVFDLLVCLLQNRDRVLSKNDLLARVWGGRIVSDATIDSRIKAARKAIGDRGDTQHLIRTVPRKGFRFTGEAHEQPSRSTATVLLNASADNETTPVHADADDSASLPDDRRRRLSIVVLPFVSLSADPEQQYFADAITENLTADLARIEHLVVVSRTTALAYRDKSIGIKQIGRELGVRYVVEGGVQRDGDCVRITVRLIDAITDTHFWAETFDRSASDMLALHGEITLRVANTLKVTLETVEANHPTERPDVLDHILRGRTLWRQWPVQKNYELAIASFEQALALDPHCSEAMTWLARVLVHRVLRQQASGASDDIARAQDLVEQALATAPADWHAHYVKGQVLSAQRRWAEAIPEFERVIALNSNFVSAYANLGWCRFWTGSIETVIALQERAVRLHNRDPFFSVLYWRIGVVQFVQSHTDEAIAALEKARVINPHLVEAHAYLAAAYGISGETERAAAELAEARKLSLDGRYSSIAQLKAAEDFGVQKIRALFEATYFVGLRKAGMPEK